jgi:hypothetical protein
VTSNRRRGDDNDSKSAESLELSVDLVTDPVVIIWHARNILAKIEDFPETDEISEIFAELELVLLDAMLRIIAMRKGRNKPRLHLVSPLPG